MNESRGNSLESGDRKNKESSFLKKKRRKPPNDVRLFWNRLKKKLQADPEVSRMTIFQSLSRLKDVPIKKLKNLIFEFGEEEEGSKMVKKLYQQILCIFREDAQLEKDYPRYTQSLTAWFENSQSLLEKQNRRFMKSDIVEGEDNPNPQPAFISPSIVQLPNFQNSDDGPSVTIPLWHLFSLQNQITYLISKCSLNLKQENTINPENVVKYEC
jgi:hypothetical protein